MSNENLAPWDAKTIATVLRTIGIEECEPKVIVQLLEFLHKYSGEILSDASLYAKMCERESISGKDVKLALQLRVGKQFLPVPLKGFLKANAESINGKPLSLPDPENLLRVPAVGNGMYGVEYAVERKESNPRKRKIT